jgi:hypothetical protein
MDGDAAYFLIVRTCRGKFVGRGYSHRERQPNGCCEGVAEQTSSTWRCSAVLQVWAHNEVHDCRASLLDLVRM